LDAAVKTQDVSVPRRYSSNDQENIAGNTKTKTSKKVSIIVCDIIAEADRRLYWCQFGFTAASYLFMLWLMALGFLAGYFDPWLGGGVAFFCLTLYLL